MHSENYNRQKIRLISLVSFLLGFLNAFLIYILGEYFSHITGTDNVAVFYLVAYSLVLIALFRLHSLVRLIGQSRALYLSLGLTILVAAFLTRVPDSNLSLALMVVFIAITSVTWVTLDMLLESFSRDQFSGRIRGLYLTIMNTGLLLAPFLSTVILERHDFGGVFFVLLLGYILTFIISLVGFRNDNAVAPSRLKFRSTFARILRSKNLLSIYQVSFAMEFFYALMVVYIPLYMRNLGFAWTEIGVTFTIMLIPFVVLQYPLGRLADKKMGEKELLGLCTVITLLATATIPFLESTNILLWGGVLFLTRVGVAGIEVLRDSYFYKQIDRNDLDIIAFFRTASPLANILGAGSAFLFLFVFPIQGLFFLVVIILALSFLSILRLKDTKSEVEGTLR